MRPSGPGQPEAIQDRDAVRAWLARALSEASAGNLLRTHVAPAFVARRKGPQLREALEAFDACLTEAIRHHPGTLLVLQCDLEPTPEPISILPATFEGLAGLVHAPPLLSACPASQEDWLWTQNFSCDTERSLPPRFVDGGRYEGLRTRFCECGPLDAGEGILEYRAFVYLFGVSSQPSRPEALS